MWRTNFFARRSAGAGDFWGRDEKMSDLIDRQAAIDALNSVDEYNARSVKAIKELPPVQPDIIRCRNCKFASGDSRICMQFGHSPIGELDFCAWAERRTDG